MNAATYVDTYYSILLYAYSFEIFDDDLCEILVYKA